MQDKVLQIVIKAKNEAEQTLKGLNRTLKENERSFKSMALVGTAGLAGITAVVATSIKAYGESERSQRQLEHAIIGVSNGTKEQVAQVNALTSALQKKAGIDGDSLNAGVAQLSTFGLQSESVVALTKSLADLTVNQNGVNAGADSYISSANIMAKALRGEFGMLSKMGIRFTEHQKNLIATGTEAQKVATIQEGFAQNLRETTDTVGGYDVMLGQLKQSFGEIQESLGKGLQPVIKKLSDVVVPFVQKIGDWVTANPQLTTTIILVTGAMFGFLTVVGLLGIAIPALTVGLAVLFSPVTLITLAIMALIGVGYLLYANWDYLKNGAISIFETIGATIMGWVNYVVELFNGLMTAISTTTSAIWESIKSVFFTSINFIVGLFAMLMDLIFPNWQGNLGMLYETAVAIWTTITTFFSGIFTTLFTTIKVSLDLIKLIWTTIWTEVQVIFTDIWNAIASVFNTVIAGIKSGMETLIAPIQKVIDLATKALALAGGAVKSAGGGISKAVKSVISRGSSITGKATGGGVQVGQSYMVGEKGPEMFTPASNGSITPNYKMAGAGGLNLTINMNGGTYLDDSVAERIGDRIIQVAKRNFRI
jgi:hypothetical protein